MLEFREQGVYCPAGDFYIDPWMPVKRAIITHAHSDHAYPGSLAYLCNNGSAEVLKYRLGDIPLETKGYNEKININNVILSFHPAGHVFGSSQVRLEYKGEVWVVSGDYKLDDDGVCPPFEVVPCHTFITESTFGLPLFRWVPQDTIYRDINQWWQENKELGITSVLMGYTLGKSQRLLKHLDMSVGKVYAHGAVWEINEALRRNGANIPFVERVVSETKRNYAGSLVLAPPSAINSPWLKKFQPYSTAYSSGWMNLKGIKRRRPVDRGFVISDHADWPGLLSVIRETGASRIFVTHGFKSVFSRYLKETGYDSYEADTRWENEEPEETAL